MALESIAGTQEQVVASPKGHPPVVNGIHHPTGVYDYGSTDHLLPYWVQAAQVPARGKRAAGTARRACVRHDLQVHYKYRSGK